MSETLNSQEEVSTVLQWITEKARDVEYKFWTLAHHLTPEMLHYSYASLNKDAAAGIDGQRAKDYELNLSENLEELHGRLRGQRYRAPAVKRVWIPKEGDKKGRPLGLPTLEDKIVQRAVAKLLESIYENDFYEFSYGYRKGKSCHQALEEIRQKTMAGMQWIIDADISSYFTSIDHGKLRDFLGKRIQDKNIIKLIGKWLKAGVLEDETLKYPDKGTPQGGVISPLLANLYLHYVLDEWFAKEVVPRLKGRAYLVRFADDFIIGCEYEEDANKIMKVLPQRLGKYALQIHAGKTKLVDFRKPLPEEKKGKSTFDFLGFRHYWGKSRRGNWIVKKKTMPNRQRRTKKRIRNWCRENRHMSVKQQHRIISAKLIGHYNYFGVTGNYPSIQKVYYWTVKQWRRWLNRRGARRAKSWKAFSESILSTYPLPLPRLPHSVMVQRCRATGK